MKISSLNYFIVDAFKSIKRNRTISFAAMITVLITFFIFGTFTLLALNFNKSIEDEAFLNLQENLGDNKGLMEGYDLNNNPLPSSFIVKLKDPSAATEVTKAVEGMTGVESIGNQQEVIDTISKFVNIIQIVGIGLFIVFIGVSVFLIMNTIKLTVYSRRREVGIMKFVGATDWFIRWPFVIEGIVIGAIGSVASTILLYFTYSGVFNWIVNSMFIVNLVAPQFVLTTLLGLFLIGGVIVGAIGSIFALRKFLVV